MCENCLPSPSRSASKPRAIAAAAGLRPATVKSPPVPAIPKAPRILTTTVGSYPVPEWLSALPSEQAVVDATRVVFDLQRQAGIDLPTDGELYRFDINHPDTNGMIEYFIRPMAGVSGVVGRSITEEFARHSPMGFRRKPAGVVTGPLGEGSLNLLADCQRAAAVAGGPFKFTVTSPYMLSRTLLDHHYRDFRALTLAVADVLAAQMPGLPAACVQVDEANIPGNPEDAPLAAEAMNRVLDAIDAGTERAVHFCFGNYGGQTIQSGRWAALIKFLNALHCDHLVLELAHRPASDLNALKAIDRKIALGVGVVDIKVNHIETADEIAARIEAVEKKVGAGRVRWVHPDCGFWMLKRSVADRKIEALVRGRDKYLGR
ncbi:cobalamin-independent methionine synthase II family protein [Oleiharenicola sp. Vm1]|uniref:cobalamin-independent methionine synthase II family protein n=1 Tax=Oleiharenicola sp. Vm1 TaxID=3398393 RepID=UPI0039F5BBBD